jgi:hypothetical protein
MPLTNSYNTLAQSNEQPEYQALWEPIAYNPSSVAQITPPANSTFPAGGYCIPGSLLMYGLTGTFAGVGSYPPLGFNSNASTPYFGGDASGVGATGNNTFPFNWTVQYVDAASVNTTVNAAGICLGFGSLGAYASPQSLTTGANNASIGTSQPIQNAMVGKRGIMQVLFDGNTTAGNTFLAASTSGHIGTCKDSGSPTTRTYGTTFGVILQTLTLSSSTPQLVWCHVNMP